MESKTEKAWTLYYNAEGYPYWFNHITGQSVWAVDENKSTIDNEFISHQIEYSNDSSESEVDSSDSDDHLDDITENKFQSFLLTKDGQEMFEAEKQLVNDKLNKKLTNIEKNQSEKNQQSLYVFNNIKPKKSDDLEISLIEKDDLSDDESLSSNDSDVQMMSEPLFTNPWTSNYSREVTSFNSKNKINSVKLYHYIGLNLTYLLTSISSLFCGDNSLWKICNNFLKKFVDSTEETDNHISITIRNNV